MASPQFIVGQQIEVTAKHNEASLWQDSSCIKNEYIKNIKTGTKLTIIDIVKKEVGYALKVNHNGIDGYLNDYDVSFIGSAQTNNIFKRMFLYIKQYSLLLYGRTCF
ncbi:MAG: hypothetical protein EOM37_11690 [Proteobacteria bacterium]|nr:hypothetical protein [Pseudomonadota bacterium]